ncbi:MAG: FHA domain-containing protein [Gloeobacterales cyanobacterium]
MHITIECLSGSLAGKTLKFNQPEISLGRGEQQKKDVDFLDTDTAVSRNHGNIFVRDERIYYTDQSRGGTLVRGEKIQGATIELLAGDELQLGGKHGPILKVQFRLPTVVDRAFIPQTPSVSSPAATVMQPGSPLPPPKSTADSTILQGIDGAKSFSPPPPKDSLAQSPAEKAAEGEEVIRPSSEATVFQAPKVPPPQMQIPKGGETVFQQPLKPSTPMANGETIFQAAPPQKATPSSEGGETMFQGTPLRTPEPARLDETYFQSAEVDPGSTIFQGTPSQVEDTGATILQDSPPSRNIPWVPIIFGLVGVIGAIWFFFLR